MILSLVNRTDVPRITDFIRTVNPGAFFSIEDVRYVNEGVFRPQKPGVLGGCSAACCTRRRSDFFSVETRMNRLRAYRKDENRPITGN